MSKCTGCKFEVGIDVSLSFSFEEVFSLLPSQSKNQLTKLVKCENNNKQEATRSPGRVRLYSFLLTNTFL